MNPVLELVLCATLRHKSLVVVLQDLNAALLEVKKLQEEVSRIQMECDESRKELSRAVLIAAEEIEERLAVAWEKEHLRELKSLEVRLCPLMCIHSKRTWVFIGHYSCCILEALFH